MDNSPSPLDTHILAVCLWDSALCRYSLDRLAFDQQWTTLQVFDKWKQISQCTCTWHYKSPVATSCWFIVLLPGPRNPGTSCTMVIPLPCIGFISTLSKFYCSGLLPRMHVFFVLIVIFELSLNCNYCSTVTESGSCHFMCTPLYRYFMHTANWNENALSPPPPLLNDHFLLREQSCLLVEIQQKLLKGYARVLRVFH